MMLLMKRRLLLLHMMLLMKRRRMVAAAARARALLKRDGQDDAREMQVKCGFAAEMSGAEAKEQQASGGKRHRQTDRQNFLRPLFTVSTRIHHCCVCESVCVCMSGVNGKCARVTCDFAE
jgi:hypothetical protein